MKETQINAYKSILSKIGEKQVLVLNAIDSNGSTCIEVSKRLNWPINRVSGRITELCNKKRIVDNGKRRINPESGKENVVWEKVVTNE